MRGTTFAYLPGIPEARAVSVTMPVRLPSWSIPFGVLPVCEMNLPEGILRERLRLAFATADAGRMGKRFGYVAAGVGREAHFAT